jgi:hypothetical protein
VPGVINKDRGCYGLPLNSQPPDLLMQLIEFFFVRDGVMGSDPEAKFGRLKF